MESLHEEQRIKNILRLVAQQKASDLHIVVGRVPTIRIDGKLFPLTQEKPVDETDSKAFADMLMSEQDKKILEENGQVDFSYNFENKVRFRVNVFYQKGMVSIAMRIIIKQIRSLESLNMPKNLLALTEYSQGLVLITGPVGHGKSTTLAALIDHINHNQEKHIVTIEDPIEYVYEQDRCIINQREIGQDAKTFAEALKSVFREDANVILLGELRDLDTIATAMTAAETGHLIFATLHTNDCGQTVDRIVDVFPAHQQNQIRSQLASVLLGVVSQRLVPLVDGGRVPAVEIMLKNDAVETLIRENKAYQIDTVIETGMNGGMISLDRSLATLVDRGLVKYEDAIRVAKNQDYLRMILKQ
jgi:twitching motility protein PilT